MTHNWKIKKQNFFCLQSKNFPPDKRHPGHRSRYGKYGPRSGYGFLRTACQPIRIENCEKPYNNKLILLTSSYEVTASVNSGSRTILRRKARIKFRRSSSDRFHRLRSSSTSFAPSGMKCNREIKVEILCSSSI